MICPKCEKEAIRFHEYKCKNCRDIYHLQWRTKNKERWLATSREWTLKNKEKSKEIKDKWTSENDTNLLSRKNYAIRKEEGRLKKYKTDPLVRTEIKNRYKAKKRSLKSEKYSAKEIFDYFGNTCVYCLSPAQALDHVDPISRGGDDTKENLVTSCKSCNSSKGNKPLLIWLLTKTNNSSVFI